MRLLLLSTAVFSSALLVLTGALQSAASQPSVIVGSDKATATVETVDRQQGVILLRGPTGDLQTIHAASMPNLPQVRPGDRVAIHHIRTVGAQIARPGDPLPQSTTSAARAAPGERPSGLIVTRERVRVQVDGIDLATNSVAFLGPDRVPRTIVVSQPAMQDFLRDLKVGDEVDVTFTDIVSLNIAAPSAASP